ncbi:MAG: NAD-dependent epimerase/dehydratase family protein [Beijerinckiaceae bacterium]|nr:NAD-dependent epimerase/dehydratase family protein [Beijerinckiaceae bacterium]
MKAAGLSASLHLMAANLAALQASRTRLVVTGPSGWLGSATLAMLDGALSDDELARQVLVFGSSARRIGLPSGRHVDCRTLADLPGTDLSDSLLLHFAYLTKDKTALTSLDDYERLNGGIHDLVVRAVADRRPSGLFFASSGAVYQNRRGPDERPDREANPYGWMKAAHEDSFASVTDAAGTAYVCGRIFSLAGEHINKVELYALGSILSALQADQPLVLRAAREVWRSYTYVGDVVNLVLALLLKRQSVRDLDMAGAEAVELGELAALCARVTGREGTPITRPPVSTDSPDCMLGDHAPYYRLLEQEGIAPLPLSEQVRATADYLARFSSSAAARHASPCAG